MGRKSRWIFIIALLVIVIIAIAVPTYAVWSGGSDITATGEIDFDDDLTYRYIVFDGITSAGKHYYMTYNDAGYYSYNSSYNIYDEEVDTAYTGEFANIVAIGYTGTLGEYESLVIPDTITWKDTNGTGSTHSAKAVTKVNMQAPTAFPSLRGIKSVVIGANVTAIEGVSFSFLPQLNKVYIKKGQSAASTLWSAKSADAFICVNTLTKYYYTGSTYAELS